MIKNYIQAARLRTLPLSLSGIIVGSFIAASEGFFNWLICLLALLTTTGFQIISNFANDYGDGVKGTDNEDRIGPKRAIQSGAITPNQMLSAIKISVIITFIVAIALIYVSFGKDDFLNLLLFFVLGIMSIVAAIKYTMGKNAYGYSGFGDVFVFLFFGLLSVCGSYYLYTKTINYTVFLPAISIGLLSVGVLNLNNLRDRASDIKAGKNTLVVKIGAEFGKYYHYYLLIASLLVALLYTMLQYTSPFQLLFLLAYIPIMKHFQVVYQNKFPKLLDPELKKLALSTFLFALLFGIGLLLS
ncbi:1,4-dihydroxy-2-naphthoate prenyltransferase [Lutibacter agarilyticus]|uniref:1,4-dihydroxy-2-naphthoate octaprenyltransferase n=1 Tax=Lutibacter agarilyticus TaxID=1109740 RepID=A0A238X1N8_9FLAO|nr:1,4-dihydroxy-2-naphthoate polyprenyltransferase [Lutibacter agarilyticus]SNR52531.1 1,4-dihydroxy-2-naphthoate prenyltransferase [Lutibacter agarilyticus]